MSVNIVTFSLGRRLTDGRTLQRQSFTLYSGAAPFSFCADGSLVPATVSARSMSIRYPLPSVPMLLRKGSLQTYSAHGLQSELTRWFAVKLPPLMSYESVVLVQDGSVPWPYLSRPAVFF